MPLLRIGARIITGRVSPTSFIGPLVSLAGIIALAFLLVTGRIDLSRFDAGMVDPPVADASRPAVSEDPSVIVQSPAQPVVNHTSDRIRLLSLNWRAVGNLTNQPQWLPRLASMLADVDVVAIQQIEPADYSAFQSLLNQLTQQGLSFGLSASDEEGRGAIRERLAFLWNQERVMLVPGTAYSILDEADHLLIEPYVASFEVRSGSAMGRELFHFCLMNVHFRDLRDPSLALCEMDVLRDVYLRVGQFEQNRQHEDDVILVGDFSSGASPSIPLAQTQSLVPIVPSLTRVDRTAPTQQILLNEFATREFTGRCASFRLDEALGLPPSGATAGALAVWAEFSADEARSATW